MNGPRLPSILKSAPAIQDGSLILLHMYDSLHARVSDCNRLFPSRERVMLHRKRDHDSGDDRDILTWN
ncbi:hypothetical protein BKA83DRAFT_671544 [Pisolithus microcarpus]|nr:hypothetical protein BKA83DRAFT_671544 [Pisolithus microcarpus]